MFCLFVCLFWWLRFGTERLYAQKEDLLHEVLELEAEKGLLASGENTKYQVGVTGAILKEYFNIFWADLSIAINPVVTWVGSFPFIISAFCFWQMLWLLGGQNRGEGFRSPSLKTCQTHSPANPKCSCGQVATCTVTTLWDNNRHLCNTMTRERNAGKYFLAVMKVMLPTCLS